MSTKTLVISVVGLAVVGGVGYLLADRFYLSPASEIAKKTEEYRSLAASYENSASGSREIAIGLRDAAATMLGGDQNLVEHHLREMLSDLAERNGLRDIVVTHGRPRPAGNPADAKGSRIPRAFRRMLGERADFAVIRGRLQGVGSLEQVSRALADLRTQPWLHKVEGFSLAPKDRAAGTYDLKADFATIFAPDLVQADAATPAMVPPDEGDVGAMVAVAERSPFMFAVAPPPEPPKPDPKPVVVQQEKPKPPPPPPYDKWRVTGVLESLEGASDGSGGVEVMLYREDTGETRTLRVGQALLGATLQRAGGEQAWFDKDGAPVVVRAGETLAQAEPAESVHSDATSPG